MKLYRNYGKAGQCSTNGGEKVTSEGDGETGRSWPSGELKSSSGGSWKDAGLPPLALRGPLEGTLVERSFRSPKGDRPLTREQVASS